MHLNWNRGLLGRPACTVQRRGITGPMLDRDMTESELTQFRVSACCGSCLLDHKYRYIGNLRLSGYLRA